MEYLVMSGAWRAVSSVSGRWGVANLQTHKPVNSQTRKLSLLYAIACCLLMLVMANNSVLAQSDPQVMTLEEALEAGVVTAVIQGRSIAFTEPMLEIELMNETETAVDIQLQQGLIFLSQDAIFSDATLYDDITINLAANQNKQVELIAYSNNPEQAFPAPKIEYSIGAVSDDPDLKVVLSRISENNAESDLAAQLAVWMQQAGQTDFDTFEKQLGEDVDIQDFQRLTLQLLGQELDTLSLVPTVAVTLIIVFIVIGLLLYARRRWSNLFDKNYQLGGLVAQGSKYRVQKARRPGGKEDLILKQPIDASTQSRCAREIEIRSQLDELLPHIVPLIGSG